MLEGMDDFDNSTGAKTVILELQGWAMQIPWDRRKCNCAT